MASRRGLVPLCGIATRSTCGCPLCAHCVRFVEPLGSSSPCSSGMWALKNLRAVISKV